MSSNPKLEKTQTPGIYKRGKLVGTPPRAESWVGFHTFRHSCATMLFCHGWNAKQVQVLLGHADEGFTLRTYVHPLPEDLPDPSFLEAVTSGVGNARATQATESGRNEAVPLAAVSIL